MESLFIFLMKASSGIILFYLVYWFFLRNETYYNANRWFLILALFASLFIPLFPVHYSIFFVPEDNTTIVNAVSSAFKNAQTINPELNKLSATKTFNWNHAILFIYLTGVAIFLFRLLSQTIFLILQILKLKSKSVKGFRIVENEKYGLPFSFFNFIFINPKFHTQENLPEILAHENVHIRENHWFDLFFIELLTVIFWFNPFIWFFEQSIKQNHEYLADQGVLSLGHKVGRYQALLLNQLMGMQVIGITNNLNFALNTNRLKMMTKKKTPKIKGYKFVWALPAIALLLFAFAEPAYKVKNAETENLISTLQESEKKFVIHGKVIDAETGNPLPGAAIVNWMTEVGTNAEEDGSFTLVDQYPAEEDLGVFLQTNYFIYCVGYETLKGMIIDSGKSLEDGESNFTFSLKRGVTEIEPKVFDRPPPPPPPPPSDLSFSLGLSASYPGGSYALALYVDELKNEISKEENVRGKAKIGFTVNEKGKVVDVKIIEKDNELAGTSAASIVMKMRDWNPAKRNNKSVSQDFIMLVEFE